MKPQELLNLNSGFNFNTNTLSIGTILSELKRNNTKINYDKDIPMEISVYKWFKGLPIPVICIEYKDEKGNKKSEIIKGGSEILNIGEFINNEDEIVIHGIKGIFNELDDNSKNYMMNRQHSFSYCLITFKDTSKDYLSYEQFKEIVEDFCL